VSEGASKAQEKRKIQAIKGVRDILPPETALWNRVEQTAHEVFATYNFAEIRLPIFEQTELFARSVGAETEIVSKEMYTFEDKPAGLPDPGPFVIPEEYTAALEHALKAGQIPGGPSNQSVLATLKRELDAMKHADAEARVDDAAQAQMRWRYALQYMRLGASISLRPEATASVCRAYIEHGMQVLPGPLKFYYMGPMFRRERPQKGRYRQFYQIGAEVLGRGVSFATDAEVIAMLMEFFEMCGLSEHTLYINSIGCNDQECRPAYLARLRTELLKVKNKLGPDSQRRIETNPLRVFDSKLTEEQQIIDKLPHIAGQLCDACRQDYEGLKNVLTMRSVKFQENWRLVRGLDYYTQTTFEVTLPGSGAQNAICGGGRYDGLVELIGGPKFSGIKGVGFAVGEDRLVDAARDSGKLEGIRPLEVYIAWIGNTFEKAQELARLLRRNHFGVEVPAEEQKLQKSLSIASRRGAIYAVIIGEDEIASGKLTVKRLADGEQKKLREAELVAYFEDLR
jgi:histidyl-tRNA synthetase